MNRAVGLLRKCVYGSWIFLCLFLVSSTAGDSTDVHLYKRSLYSEPSKSVPGPEKNYTGVRLRPDSLLLLYYHEQTVAIVETDLNRMLYNCELLEVRTKADKQVALNSLKPVVPVQMRIAFNDMMDLMNECNKLDVPWGFWREHLGQSGPGERLREARQLISIFSGTFPGTKWCGPGDLAASYHDLGQDRQTDKCCRHHDLCPVKVAGFKTQYNLTNYAFYTRSHCKCDDVFYNCLKAIDSTTSKTLGRIYFNVAPVVCVEDAPVEQGSHTTKKEFSTLKKRF